MGYIEVGIIIKSVKICILVLFLILLTIQFAKLEQKIIRNTKILFSVPILFGLILHIFDIVTISNTGTLMIPTSDPYFGWNMIRLTLVVLLGFFLIIIGVRLAIYITKQSVPQGTFKRGGYVSPLSGRGYINPIATPQEPPRSLNSSDIRYTKVNIRFIIASTICYVVFFVISTLIRPLQRTYDFAWIIVELVEFPFLIFIGVSMVLFKQQKKQSEQLKQIKN